MLYVLKLAAQSGFLLKKNKIHSNKNMWYADHWETLESMGDTTEGAVKLNCLRNIGSLVPSLRLFVLCPSWLKKRNKQQTTTKTALITRSSVGPSWDCEAGKRKRRILMDKRQGKQESYTPLFYWINGCCISADFGGGGGGGRGQCHQVSTAPYDTSWLQLLYLHLFLSTF